MSCFVCLKAFEELEDLLAKYQICIAVKEKLVKDSGVAEETAYDNIVQKLLTKPRARGKFESFYKSQSSQKLYTYRTKQIQTHFHKQTNN